jgi:membrane protein required for colicin V production
MNPLDAGLCVVALISMAAGALRGFVREAAALAGWALAVVLVLNLAHGLGERLPFGTDSGAGAGGIRTAVAALLIVVACALGASLVGRLLRAALTAAKLGGPDRALGALFGAIRAAAVAMVVAVVVLHTGLAQRPFWKSSRAAPWLEAALRFASPGIIPAAQRQVSVTGV